MAPTVQRVQEIGVLTLGEAPHWDAGSQSLYLVDVPGQNLHRYVPSTKQHTKANTGTKVSFIIPVKNEKNKFVITQDKKIAVVNWDGVSEKVSIAKSICEIDEGIDGNSLNDGKADPSGRLWTGSLGKMGEAPTGTFVSLEKGKVTTHLTKVGISNGIAFNVAAKKLYYIDSAKLTVDQFDFDIQKGTIANRESVFSLDKYKSDGPAEFFGPDGMTIDTDGNLWVAVFNKSKVIKIDPRTPETLLDTIVIPAKQVTSVTFGGKNLDELYITTGRFTMGEEKVDFNPEDGAVFKVTGLGVKGFAGDNVAL